MSIWGRTILKRNKRFIIIQLLLSILFCPFKHRILALFTQMANIININTAYWYIYVQLYTSTKWGSIMHKSVVYLFTLACFCPVHFILIIKYLICKELSLDRYSHLAWWQLSKKRKLLVIFMTVYVRRTDNHAYFIKVTHLPYESIIVRHWVFVISIKRSNDIHANLILDCVYFISYSTMFLCW